MATARVAGVLVVVVVAVVSVSGRTPRRLCLVVLQRLVVAAAALLSTYLSHFTISLINLLLVKEEYNAVERYRLIALSPNLFYVLQVKGL